MKQSVFLIGFMGSGKTYWGRRLGEAFDVPFYDLDATIVAHAGKTIPEIFAESGEEGFRRQERTRLLELLDQSPCIVATGGGTPCFFDNMEQMNLRGRTVFLDLPLAELLSRLERGKHKRPLLAGLSTEELPVFIEKMLEKRLPFYEKAQEKPEWSGVEAEYFERLVAAAVY